MQAIDEAAAEMAVLRSYLISKLMWNPDADENDIIDDFVMGYYGVAVLIFANILILCSNRY